MTNQFLFKTEKDKKVYAFIVSGKPCDKEGLSEETIQEQLEIEVKQKIVFDYLTADPKRVADFQKVFDERPLDAFNVFYNSITK